MNLELHDYPDDEYTKIRLAKQNLTVNGKPFSDYFAITNNLDSKPQSDDQYPPSYLLSNMHTLNDHMRLELSLKEVKKMAELVSNNNDDYKTTMYILYYKKLKSFYTLLTIFILQLTHVFYWDEFEYSNNLMRSKKSGIDLQRSLKLAMQIGADMKKSFERVLYEEFKYDPMLNSMFKSGIFPESQNDLHYNQYEKQFPEKREADINQPHPSQKTISKSFNKSASKPGTKTENKRPVIIFNYTERKLKEGEEIPQKKNISRSFSKSGRKFTTPIKKEQQQ